MLKKRICILLPTNCLKIFLLFDSSALAPYFVISLICLWILTFFIVFPKIALFINLKKSFSKSFFFHYFSYVFIWSYNFSKAFWLNLITLCTFFNKNPWFGACFKFLICVTYSFLSCKLAKTFSNFILSGKNVNHCEGYVVFQDIENQV